MSNSFSGATDLLGQLRDGRLLGVEVKAQAGRLRPEQAVFLERVRDAGGVAFVARDLRDVLRELGTLAVIDVPMLLTCNRFTD